MATPDGSVRSLATPLSRLVDRLAADEDRLVEELTRRWEVEIPFLGRGAIDRADLVASATANFRAALRALGACPATGAARGFDASQPSDTGARWARLGVPLPDAIAHYRIGARFVWEALVETAAAAGVPSEHLVETASTVFRLQDRAIEAMTSSYRAELAAVAADREAERSALVEALVEGRATATATMWEIADLLRIPREGPYVVVAADLTDGAGSIARADPDVGRPLRAAGFASAWQLLPWRRIGVVHLPHGRGSVRPLVDELRRCSPRRQGLSPAFDDLARTALATRLARAALLGASPDDRNRVLAFDDAPLPITSVAAPEINRYVADAVLAGFADLAPGQRAVLLETLHAWLDHSGSATVTARHLHLHRNTVRQRMARIEQLTHRSLSDPWQVAELCLALETSRRLT